MKSRVEYLLILSKITPVGTSRLYYLSHSRKITARIQRFYLLITRLKNFSNLADKLTYI